MNKAELIINRLAQENAQLRVELYALQAELEILRQRAEGDDVEEATTDDGD